MSIQVKNNALEAFQFRKYDPPQQLLKKLKHAQNLNKAVLFYLKKLNKKMFQRWRAESLYNYRLQQIIKSYYYKILKQNIFVMKAQRIMKKNGLRRCIKNSYQIKFQRVRNENIQLEYNFNLMKKYFQAFKEKTRQDRLYKKVTMYLKQRYFLQVVDNLKKTKEQNINQKQQNYILDGFHAQYLKKITLYSFKLHAKTQKLISIRKKKHLLQFIKNYKFKKESDKQIVQSFQKQHYLSLGFKSLQLNIRMRKIQAIHQKLSIIYSFKQFRKNFRQSRIKLQQSKNNQYMVQAYLNRKNHLTLMYSFKKWKNFVQNKLQNRKENLIIQQYSQIKQKSTLLKKYFNQLKLFIKINKSQKFHQNKLKCKVIQSLKIITMKNAEKWQNVKHFVQQRQVGKYFIAIQKYNKQYKNKIQKHLLKNYFDKFTLSLSKIYYQNKMKAINYNHQNLLFKSVYALKKEVQLTQKTNLLFLLINCKIPLNKWRKRFSLKQFIQRRQYILKAKIMRQWKLMLINNSSISKKRKNKPQQQTENQNYNYISQNKNKSRINTFASPSKLIQLSYSDWGQDFQIK